jgi:hypothetical protein
MNKTPSGTGSSEYTLFLKMNNLHETPENQE